MRFLLFIFISIFLSSCSYLKKNINQLQRTKILSVYLTWDSPNTSNHMVINYVTSQMPKLAHLSYDVISKNSIIETYTSKIRGKTQTIKGVNFFVTKFKIQNLIPQKDYYFIVGDQVNGFSREFKFQTIGDGQDEIEFIQGGDMTYSKDVIAITKKAVTKKTRALLIGGDLAYANGNIANIQKWDNWFHNLNEMTISPSGHLLPLIVAIGNHETNFYDGFDPRLKAPFYFLFFEQNQKLTYFYRKLGKDTILFVLDSGHVYKHGKNQKKWLKSKLKEFNRVKNKLTMYHVPLYPSARKYNYKLSEKGRKHWLPLFDKYKVILSFENHDHMLKRTKPLINNKVSLNANGTIYLGDGCWGKEPRQYSKRWYLEKSIPVKHVWRASLSKNKIDIKAIGLDGGILDHFIKDTSLNYIQ